MNDSDILDLYRSGRSEQAFNEIVKAYSERVYWQVRPMCASHEDADDLVQDIFVKIWNALPSFRGEAQLYSWIYRIASNTAISFLKKSGRNATVSLDDSGADRVAGDPYFDGDEAERLMRSAILSLPPRQRQVFTLRHYDELSYEEISLRLGTSVSALKASCHFATEKVRRFLQKKISR